MDPLSSPPSTTSAKTSLPPSDPSSQPSDSQSQDIPASQTQALSSSEEIYSERPRQDAVARGSFVRHLVDADAEEHLHASEAVTPASCSPAASSPLTVVDKGKGRADPDSSSFPLRPLHQTLNLNSCSDHARAECEWEGYSKGHAYFGSRSQMRAQSVREEPHTPVKGEGWGSGKEGEYWGSSPSYVDPREVSSDDQGGWKVGDNLGNHGAKECGWERGFACTCGGWQDNSSHQNYGLGGCQGNAGWTNTNHQSYGWGHNNVNNGVWENDLSKQRGWGRIEEDGKVFDADKNPDQGWGQNYGHGGTQHDHRYEQRGHIRARHGSEATVRPYEHHTGNHHRQQCEYQSLHQSQSQRQTPQNNNQNDHHYTYDHHPRNQSSSNSQNLIDELRTQNAQQAELTVEQRIRIAVLENEAKHIKQSKEDAVNASLIIAQTLGTAFKLQYTSPRRSAASPHIVMRELGPDEEETEERKVAALKEESAALKAKFRKHQPAYPRQVFASSRGGILDSPSCRRADMEVDLMKRKIAVLNEECEMLKAKLRRSKQAAGVKQEAGDEDGLPAPNTLCEGAIGRAMPYGGTQHSDESKSTGNGEEENTFQPTGTNYYALHKARTCPEGLRRAYEKENALAAQQAGAAGAFMTLPRGELDNAAATDTAKNASKSRGIAGWAESFVTTSDIPTEPNSPVLNPTSFSSSQSTNPMTDVGIHSLDDVLGGEVACLPAPSLQPGDHLLGELDTDIESLEPQIQAQMRALQSLPQAPAPKVLKTGIDLKNSFRGAEYDNLAPQPLVQPRSMSDINRFDPSSTANPCSSLNASSLWSSEEEKERVVKLHQNQVGREGVRYPDLFRYGLQYVPEEDDENFMRTVAISNLPTDVTLREVLLRVRGGRTANAVLMDTRKLMGGRMSALVKFVEDYDAKAFVEYVAEHPITFGEDEEVQLAEVKLIPTPTYPPNQGMFARAKQGRQGTRCLAVRNLPRNLSLSKLQRDIAGGNIRRGEGLLEIFLDEQHTLHLEFSDMSLAGSSMGILTGWQCYRGLCVTNAPDPCAGPLEELALPVPLRPPMLPRNADGSFDSDQEEANSSSDSFTDCRARFHPPTQDKHQQHRRRLPSIPQKVVIPSFSGTGLKSSSWADEVEEEELGQFGDSNGVVAGKIASYIEHDELPHAHSNAPPNSPHEDIEGVGAKGAIDMLAIPGINRLMLKNPSPYPVGLAGSCFAPIIPAQSSSLQNLSLEVDGYVCQTSKDGKGKEVETPQLRHHLGLDPSSLLAAALGSEFGSDSQQSIISEHMPEEEVRRAKTPTPYPSPSKKINFHHINPTYDRHRSLEQSPTPTSAHIEEHSTPLERSSGETDSHKPASILEEETRDTQTPKPHLTHLEEGWAVGYVLNAPPSTNRVLEPSPTPGSYCLGEHTVPLAEFTRAIDEYEGYVSEGGEAAQAELRILTSKVDTPHTPANTTATPQPQTPRKANSCVQFQHKAGSGESYADAEWTSSDLETVRNASPGTKERHGKLMEMGREVGKFCGEELMSEVQSDGVPGNSNGDGIRSQSEQTPHDDEDSFRNASPKTKERYAKLLEMGREVGEFNCSGVIPELRSEGENGGGSGSGTEGTEKRAEKINPGEIDLELDDDEAEVADNSKNENGKESYACRLERADSVHIESCAGYMSIGG